MGRAARSRASPVLALRRARPAAGFQEERQVSGFPIPIELTIETNEGPIKLLLLSPMALVRMHHADPEDAQRLLWLLHDEREIRLMTVACLILNTLSHGRNAAITETAAWLVGLVEMQST
jgi:hypothetical protein